MIYNSINDVVKILKVNGFSDELDDEFNKEFNEDIVSLLSIMEKVNPCSQQYELCEDCLIISYNLKINLLNFKNLFPLNANVQITGMPLSVSKKGYFGNLDSVIRVINKRKGLKILLNSNQSKDKGWGRTLSSFVFENYFDSFDDYLNSLRSAYRRRINKALKNREKMVIRKLKGEDFNQNHYQLYLSIMKRTDNPLETLTMSFFKEYDGELYEFKDKQTGEIVGFIQLKEINSILYFLFGGFRKEDNEYYDIYYNMLLKIIEVGIEKRVKIIEFGQTSEECKLKIGCREVPKYMYVHHSNRVLNFLLEKLVIIFSYKPYNINHHVFK